MSLRWQVLQNMGIQAFFLFLKLWFLFFLNLRVVAGGLAHLHLGKAVDVQPFGSAVDRHGQAVLLHAGDGAGGRNKPEEPCFLTKPWNMPGRFPSPTLPTSGRRRGISSCLLYTARGV